MVSTFINPVVNPDQPLGLNAFTETAPIHQWPTSSVDELQSIVNAIYKQVLSNAYVMESERQQVPESQFKRGELSILEFVRQIAKSDLYRTRFFENGSRNRFIELNFKHFLGRAPENLAEVAAHSAILDSEGYEAEIDSYLDSDEYLQNFGTDTVPYYRGYKTEAATPAGFTHMFTLLRGASSSDKHVVANNPARLTSRLLSNSASTVSSPTGATNRKGLGKNATAEDLIKAVFSRPAMYPSTAASKATQNKAQVPQKQSRMASAWASASTDAQAEKIEQLQKQLDELRSLSNMGAAILRKGQRPTATTLGNSSSPITDPVMQIEKLQGELMSARSLANIADFKLNKWRSRSY